MKKKRKKSKANFPQIRNPKTGRFVILSKQCRFEFTTNEPLINVAAFDAMKSPIGFKKYSKVVMDEVTFSGSFTKPGADILAKLWNKGKLGDFRCPNRFEFSGYVSTIDIGSSTESKEINLDVKLKLSGPFTLL